MRYHTLRILICSFFILIACTSETEESAPQGEEEQGTDPNLSEVNIEFFIKENDGTIQEQSANFKYSYASGKLSRIEETYTAYGNSNSSELVFVYDGNELERIEPYQDRQLLSTINFEYLNSDKTKVTFTRDGRIGEFDFVDGQLMELKYFFESGETIANSMMIYEEDSNVKSLYQNVTTQFGTTIDRFEYSYDSMTSPYMDLPIEYKMLFLPPSEFGQNNLIRSVNMDNNENIKNEFEYSYEFNSNGYPTLRNKTNLDDEIVEIATFLY